MSSSKVAALLKIKVLSWSQETGFPERSFHLHKVRLRCNSGNFKEKLKDETTNEVKLPPDFPSGAEAFELTALLMYGHGALVEADNVAALRCATDFLELRRHCQGLDMYLNQILDPEQGRDQALQQHKPWPWRDAVVGDVVSRDDTRSPAVAQLWDQYLTNIVADPDFPCTRLITLIQTIIPHSSRHTHDYLYTALDLFFRSHPNLSQEEKASLCKYLDCQKLSPPVCIEALRNEVMLLRLMMQALFVHAQHMSMPPGHNNSYEPTAFRIQNLEKELQSLKRTLHLHRSKNHQKSSCIATLTFTLHRKYADKVRNILHQLLLFGGGKSKRNIPAFASFPN
ncbi:hypothetical protein SASPL_116173 [Salvia splendens]|uniref:NPH3 domain-containing protein n=1 Tax=Salvia splendens TaxID=180675 RepID=A0A8X8XVM0_SALSN|nr:hypothetical protein SASPL_116173 [Salvia splendens]